jgi:hypothetical protein
MITSLKKEALLTCIRLCYNALSAEFSSVGIPADHVVAEIIICAANTVCILCQGAVLEGNTPHIPSGSS